MKALFQSGTAALLGVTLLMVSAGCKDKRIDTAPSADRQVTVEAPGANVRVDTPPATPVVPRPGEGVDVNVGPGGVQVDVEGAPFAPTGTRAARRG